MQFFHQGVSFICLTGVKGAGASQALISGWVSEDQLKTVLLLLFLTLCLREAGWGEWALCSHFSRLVLVQPPVGPLSPRAAAQLCLASLELWGLPCVPRDGQRAPIWVSLSQSCLLWER